MRFSPQKILTSALISAAVISAGHASAATEIAPYFQVWTPGMLTDAKRDSGLNSATLAFAITNGTCALNSNMLGKLPDARNFVASGGKLIISLGGEQGTYLEVACTDENQLFNLVEKLMLDSGTRRIDFDVEGSQLNNTVATARRARVLARLQAKYPDMYVSFTLPGWLRGLGTASIDLLKVTQAAGVRITRVNVMAMSFGQENLRTMVVPSTVAQAGINTMRATVVQLASVFPGKTTAQLYAMMGITPMVGVNDDGATFTLADAKTIADFVRANNIGLLSYWSFQRDRAQATPGLLPLNAYSGVTQSANQFYNIFKTAQSTTTAVPAPAPAPTSCTTGNWVVGQNYAAGSIVNYNGAPYIAKYANPGYNPTISTYYWAAYKCPTSTVTPGTTAPAPAPAPVPAPAPSPAPAPAPITSPSPSTALVACTSPTWVTGRSYAAGNLVQYQGRLYRAKYANPGYNPTISTYYWAAYSHPAWVTGKSYSAGNLVTYSGKPYSAKFANPGYNPSISTYYWAGSAC